MSALQRNAAFIGMAVVWHVQCILSVRAGAGLSLQHLRGDPRPCHEIVLIRILRTNLPAPVLLSTCAA